ncbi:MAG: excisionase [Sphingomonas sp.]|nr:MAG: excisionase [Sphingomonas sp.]
MDALSSSSSAQGPRPLAVRVADATRLTGIGKTKLFELIANGTLETTSVGRRRLILYRSLQQLIEGPAGSGS